MTRTQFWILNVTVLLAGLLFAFQIYLSRKIRVTEQQILVLQRAAQEGSGYYSRWEKLALRTYQFSLQDPQLKEVLVRQQIQVTPKPGNSPGKTPGAATPEATSSQTPASLPSTPVKSSSKK